MSQVESGVKSNHSHARVVRRLALYMLAFVSILTVGLVVGGVDHWYYVLPGFPVYGLALLVNNEKRYILARNIIFFGSFVLFTFWGFTHRRTGAEYGLIAVLCSIPMVYRNTKALVSLLLLVGFTLLSYVLLDKLSPFTPDPTINYPILSTFIMLVASGNILVQIFLNRQNLFKYLTLVKSKNEELAATLYEKKETEVQLQKTNKELQELTEQLNWIVRQKTMELQTYVDAINVNIYSSIIDVKGNFIKINEPLLKATGYSDAELIGANYRLLDAGYSEIAYARVERIVQAGQSWRGEVKYRTKTGSYYWCDQVVIPIRTSGNAVSYYLTLGLPTTERKLNDEMRDKALNLLQKIAFQTSHNVRGPMARIQGLVSLIRHDMVAGDELKYVSKSLAESTEELNLATSDLVNFVNSNEGSFAGQQEENPL